MDSVMSEATAVAQEKVGALVLGPGRTIAYRHIAPTSDKRLATVVFLGGFMSDMMGRKAEALAQVCSQRGQGFLRFDHFAHGQSSGTMEDATVGDWAMDAVAVLDQLTDGPLVLVGSSMGAWVMLLAALARPQRMRGLIGLAAAPDFTEELVWNAYTPEEQEKLIRDGKIVEPSPYGERPYIFTRRLIEDGRRHLLLNGSIAIGAPVRLIHGMADRDVPYTFALRLADKLATQDVVVTLIKDADHRLSRDEDLARIAAVVAELSGYAPTASSVSSPMR
jgi:pimeloyl-ACP methyl ester carboxylesterase